MSAGSVAAKGHSTVASIWRETTTVHEESATAATPPEVRWLPDPSAPAADTALYPGSDELPALYRSIWSVLPYFRVHGLLANAGVCLSADPRHVIYFRVTPDGSARISNELIALDPETATSISRAIFSESPRVDRVVWTHIEGDLGRAALPRLVHSVIKSWSIDLPAKVEDCRELIGRQTYRNLRKTQGRLHRTFADAEFRVIEKDGIDAQLVHELVEMNRRRFSRKQMISMYESYPDLEPRLVAILGESGFGGLLYVDGNLIAGALCSAVDTACFCQLVAHHEDYDRFSPGRMCDWLMIEECVRRGLGSYWLGWGFDSYKQRLGAHADDLWTVTLYRSRGAQVRHWREATKAHARRLTRGGLTALGLWPLADRVRQRRAFKVKRAGR